MMRAMDSGQIICQQLPTKRKILRVAVVTETYPPEINGVAMTISRMVAGLQQRQHQIQLIRPRQSQGDYAASEPNFEEVLQLGVAIPRYDGLKMGLPAKHALVRLWSLKRPDLVHVVTEGPLGWSALAAAVKLKIPCSSDFHTNFHSYSKHYGIGWLKKPIGAYLRRFHNTGEDLAAHYASGDVFLFPSTTETFGNVTVEAMASGLAVIAYDYAAAAEHIKHGHNGLVTDFDNAREFVNLAALLIDDAQRISAFGRRARKTTERIDWEHVHNEFEAALLDVIASRERRAYDEDRMFG
jgi:glycosyltransferase involved in cell wall biosynthesis